MLFLLSYAVVVRKRTPRFFFTAVATLSYRYLCREEEKNPTREKRKERRLERDKRWGTDQRFKFEGTIDRTWKQVWKLNRRRWLRGKRVR